MVYTNINNNNNNKYKLRLTVFGDNQNEYNTDIGKCFSKHFFIIKSHTYVNVFLSDKSKFLLPWFVDKNLD
jgi:hypothetical protein